VVSQVLEKLLVTAVSDQEPRFRTCGMPLWLAAGGFRTCGMPLWLTAGGFRTCGMPLWLAAGGFRTCGMPLWLSCWRRVLI